jgi:hypothetical protein
VSQLAPREPAGAGQGRIVVGAEWGPAGAAAGDRSGRPLGNLAKRNLSQLTALVKTRLKRMRCRPGLLDGFLASTRPGRSLLQPLLEISSDWRLLCWAPCHDRRTVGTCGSGSLPHWWRWPSLSWR